MNVRLLKEVLELLRQAGPKLAHDNLVFNEDRTTEAGQMTHQFVKAASSAIGDAQAALSSRPEWFVRFGPSPSAERGVT